jgi:hypothetical protein
LTGAFEHFVVEDFANGFGSSSFSGFDVTFDLLWFFLHQADELRVKFFICFIFENSWVVINTSE